MKPRILTPEEMQHLSPQEKLEYAFRGVTPRIGARLAALQTAQAPAPPPADVGLVSTPRPKRTRSNPREQQVKAGRARMASLTAEQRSASARKAVEARWARIKRTTLPTGL